MMEAQRLGFFCIGDEDTVRGFRLAGVDGRVAVDPSQAQQALRDVLSQAGLGIIIITDDAAAWIRSDVDATREARTIPLIVEIPGPLGASPGRRNLQRILQQAVGVNVDEEGPQK